METYQKLRTATSGQRLGFLLQDTLVYGMTTALTKLMGLITLPVLTKSLLPEQYGLIDSMSVVLAVVVGVCSFGQDSAIALLFFNTDDREQRRRLVSQGVVIQLALALPLIMALAVGHNMVSRLLYQSDSFGVEVLLAVAGIPAALVLQSTRNLLKWTFLRKPFMMISVGLSACQMVFLLVLVWGAGLEVRGYLLGLLLANLIFAGLGAYYCRTYWMAGAGTSRVRELLILGWPYMATCVVCHLVPAVDRMCVVTALSLEQAGYYAVGFRVASLIMFPVMAFQTAWGPFCYALCKEADAGETYNRILLLFTISVSFGAYLLSLAAVPVINLLARPAYLDGAVVVLPLAFAGALQGISWISGIGIELARKPTYSLVSYLVGLSVTFCAVWGLVGDFGTFGVGVGVLLGSLAQCVTYTAFGYLCYPLRFRLIRPVAALITAGAAGLLNQWMPGPTGPMRIAWQSGWLLGIFMVFWLVILPKTERQAVSERFSILWRRVRG